jgi:hypothetical protein
MSLITSPATKDPNFDRNGILITTSSSREPPQFSEKVVNHSVRYSLCLKVQALTLLTAGYPFQYVEKITGIPSRTLHRIKTKAAQRGYRPADDPRILASYLEDGKRPGRPKKVTIAAEIADESDEETSPGACLYEGKRH